MNYPVAYNTLTEADIESAISTIRSGMFTMGREVEAFEAEFAEYNGSKYAVMVNSGSSADFVMMLAAVELGILHRNSEITMAAVTWPTQAWAALLSGLRIRFVDVNRNTLQAAEPVDFAVHLIGNPQFLNRPKFEDCCEALGAKWNGRHVGTHGVAGSFSFFFSHHITTIEGGMIITDDPLFADMCRTIRAHGWIRDLADKNRKAWLSDLYDVDDDRFLFIGPGLNFRPTEMSAAIGRSQLKRVDAMNDMRNAHFYRIAGQFTEATGETSQIRSVHEATPAWFCLPFIVRAPLERRPVMQWLKSQAVDSRPIMGGNLMRQPIFSKGGYWAERVSAGALPVADEIHRAGFYVGLPPQETEIQPLIQALQQMGVYRYATA